MNWWERGEWSDQRGETNQAWPDFYNASGADLLGDASATAAMYATPLGEPPSDFDVRSVYESRPVNAYDFNYSSATPVTGANSTGEQVLWATSFSAPNGYRAVPKKWDIAFDPPYAVGVPFDSTVNITQANAAVPNNQNLILGTGTDEPIETFFVCEENTTFGASGSTSLVATGYTVNVNVNVWGTLIPVSEVSPPFCIANQVKFKNSSEEEPT